MKVKYEPYNFQKHSLLKATKFGQIFIIHITIKPIKNKEQYDDALEKIYSLMQKNLEQDSKESDELEFLSILVKEYERENYLVPEPLPLEAIKFRMDQMNISEAEISKILGARSRKSEIFSGKRKLRLSMIRKLKEKLNISADVLIQEY